MPGTVAEMLVWLRSSGLRIVVITAGSILLIRLLRVESMTDAQVTIRVLAKTLHLKQWDVAREFRRRIKARFDREGIQTPNPHRIVILHPAADVGK